MGNYQQRPNSGTLFKNDRKEKPTHPDYQGDAEINGEAVRISAWIKEGRKGKFMSLAFKPKADRQQFGQMRETVDRNVSDVPTGAEPKEPEQRDIPF